MNNGNNWQNNHQNNYPRRVGNYGTVRNINNKRLNSGMKLKLCAIAVSVTIIATSIIGIISYNNGYSDGKNSVKPEVNLIPQDCIMLSIPIEVNTKDTVSEIAEQYYTEDYEGMYSSLDIYVDAILKASNKSNANIRYGDKLNVPLIVNSNNEYYIKMMHLEQQIKEIEKKEYWIDYEIVLGDSISYLASEASGTEEETNENTYKILEKNDIKQGTIIYPGMKIKTINPKLGPLKVEYNEIMELFIESIKNNDVKTK